MVVRHLAKILRLVEKWDLVRRKGQNLSVNVAVDDAGK